MAYTKKFPPNLNTDENWWKAIEWAQERRVIIHMTQKPDIWFECKDCHQGFTHFPHACKERS